MRHAQLPNKTRGEIVLLNFDFSSSLVGTDSLIGTPTLTIVPYSGADPNSGFMGGGVPTRFGNTVQAKVVGGVEGVIYQVICSCPTTVGALLTLQGFLAVLPEPTF